MSVGACAETVLFHCISNCSAHRAPLGRIRQHHIRQIRLFRAAPVAAHIPVQIPGQTFVPAGAMNRRFTRGHATWDGRRGPKELAQAGGGRCGASGGDHRQSTCREGWGGGCEVRARSGQARRSARHRRHRHAAAVHSSLASPPQCHPRLRGTSLPIRLKSRPGPRHGQRPRLCYPAPAGAARHCRLLSRCKRGLNTLAEPSLWCTLLTRIKLLQHKMPEPSSSETCVHYTMPQADEAKEGKPESSWSATLFFQISSSKPAGAARAALPAAVTTSPVTVMSMQLQRAH